MALSWRDEVRENARAVLLRAVDDGSLRRMLAAQMQSQNGSELQQWKQKLTVALDNSYGTGLEGSPQRRPVERPRFLRKGGADLQTTGEVPQTPMLDTWSPLPMALSERVQEKVSKEEAFLLGSLRTEGRLERILRERCASAERRAEQTAEQAWSRCRSEWQRVEATRDRAAQLVEATSGRLEKMKKERDVQAAEIAKLRSRVESNASKWSEERSSLAHEREHVEAECFLYAELEASRHHALEERQEELAQARSTIQEAIAAAKAKQQAEIEKGDATPLTSRTWEHRAGLHDITGGSRNSILSVLMGSERSRSGSPTNQGRRGVTYAGVDMEPGGQEGGINAMMRRRQSTIFTAPIFPFAAEQRSASSPPTSARRENSPNMQRRKSLYGGPSPVIGLGAASNPLGGTEEEFQATVQEFKATAKRRQSLYGGPSPVAASTPSLIGSEKRSASSPVTSARRDNSASAERRKSLWAGGPSPNLGSAASRDNSANSSAERRKSLWAGPSPMGSAANLRGSERRDNSPSSSSVERRKNMWAGDGASAQPRKSVWMGDSALAQPRKSVWMGDGASAQPRQGLRVQLNIGDQPSSFQFGS